MSDLLEIHGTGDKDFNEYFNAIKQPDFILNDCVTTKLFIPNPPAKLVSRKRLMDKIEDITNKKLTIISAPAGYGKTTLLSQWAVEKGKVFHISWVTLSEEENELYSFWAYIMASLKENFKDGTIEYLLSLYKDKTYKIENIVNVLINKIVLNGKEVVIILDDYHMITNNAIHHTIWYFLSHIPSNVHLILCTRNKPNIPISKFRIKEEVLELDIKDIRFNNDEIFDLFQNVYETDVSIDQLTMINKSAEGWISALKVIAMHMKNYTDNSILESRISSNRQLFDYLTEEIIDIHPKSIKEFLYKTSFLKFLNSSVCNEVLQINNSEEVLELLIQNNTFIVSLNEKQDYFRYHSIFSDLLRKGLNKYFPDEVNSLYLKASLWYENNGFFYEAVDISLKSNDFENSIRLLDKYINKMLENVDLRRLVHIIKTFPKEILMLKPRIVVFYYCALAILGTLQEDLYLNNLGIDLDSDAFKDYQALIYSIRTFYVYRDQRIDTESTEKFTETALGSLPEEDPLSIHLKTFLYCNLGTASSINGDLEQAKKYLQLSLNVIQQTESLDCTILVMLQEALLLSFEGKVKETLELFSRTYAVLEIRNQHRNSCTNVIHSCSGISYYELNELEMAYDTTLKAIELSRVNNDMLTQLCGYMMLSKILFAQGKKREALEIIKSIEHADYNERDLLRHYKTDWVRTLINIGDPKLLSRIERKFKIELSQDINYDNEEKNIAAVEILMLNNDLEEAESGAQRIFDLANQQNRRWSIVKLLIIRAIIKWRLEDKDSAILFFKHAVERSIDCGYRRLFIDFGQDVALLLRELIRATEGDLASSNVRNYAVGLLGHFETDSQEQPPESIKESHSIISPREIEVLACIIEGLTNDEISSKLYISISTVKKHIKGIYAKLNVNNRTKAIKIARELNLI